MTKDTNGKWNGRKYNFRQVDLTWQDGFKIRSTVCSACLESLDVSALMDSITAQGTEACSQEKAEMIKSKGIPSSVVLSKTAQGVKIGV
jgi:hypothetical protein